MFKPGIDAKNENILSPVDNFSSVTISFPIIVSPKFLMFPIKGTKSKTEEAIFPDETLYETLYETLDKTLDEKSKDIKKEEIVGNKRMKRKFVRI